jgi:glucose/arabinose dehydrogenase
MSRLVAAPLLALALIVGACSDDDTAPTTTTTAGSTSTSSRGAPSDAATALADVGLRIEVAAELDSPIALAVRPGSSDLYVAEKAGRVVRLGGDGAPETIVDISDEVLDQGEQGLLGLAFSADGAELYLDFIHRGDESTRVIAIRLADDSRRELLRVEQPYANHNGGQLVLGPDGYLYVGLGDGGSGGDPLGHGQDTDTLLGSILRIDPAGAPADGEYAIPPDNPFVDEGGEPEIWLYGVRNPWRFTFDRDTGDLWVADVGQGEVEEIDLLPATEGRDPGRGANLGWNLMEGSRPFEGENPSDGVLPVHEYTHDDGCSITGGYVYRGASIPALHGTYLFADYCESDLRGIRVEGGAVVDEHSWDLSLEGIQSFGEGPTGEVYVLLASGPVLRLVTD